MNNHINDISNLHFSVICYISFYNKMQPELTWLRISSNYIVGLQCGQLHECAYFPTNQDKFCSVFLKYCCDKKRKTRPAGVILAYNDIHKWQIAPVIESMIVRVALNELKTYCTVVMETDSSRMVFMHVFWSQCLWITGGWYCGSSSLNSSELIPSYFGWIEIDHSWVVAVLKIAPSLITPASNA